MSDPHVHASAIHAVEPTNLPEVLYLQPRCRVCRDDVVREKVNGMLARGATYASIVRALERNNAELDDRDRVTVDSVRRHASRHFGVQNAAAATYREILERRAKENGIDFANGVATAITPMAFFETVMVRGYEALAQSDAAIDVTTAMAAATRLQALVDSKAGETSLDQVILQVNRIIDAVRSTVPQAMWGEITRKLQEDEVAYDASDGSAENVIEIDDEPFEPDFDFDDMAD